MADKKAPFVEYENRGRTLWLVDLLPAVSGDPFEERVIGDRDDREVKGARNHIHQPDPVLRLAADEEARIAPHSRKMLEKLTSGPRPQIERREVAA